MKSKIPYTIGYEIDRALSMLDGYHVTTDETSTPFQDKKDERKENTPIVVRQIQDEDSVHLTVARFR
ncbi:MAG: hypothetical protein K0Q99_1689 [Clostridia bacterium]|nr:hypothetical protein [Clostridia bacterium]